MSDHRYKLLYKLEVPPKPLTKDEVPEGWSATDALLLVSMLYPDDGSFSSLILPVDGRPGVPLDSEQSVLSDDEMFKVWSLMAKRLSESKTLGAGKKDFARMVFETIRAAIMGQRGRGDPH